MNLADAQARERAVDLDCHILAVAPAGSGKTGLLVQRLLAALAQRGLPAEVLEVEVTESVFLHPDSAALDELRQLRRSGIRLALDDFGTGYSSLAHFRQLPVDVLKVDRSFVQNMTESPEDHEIVDSIIRLAHAFNREVIAEGVETVEQGRALLGLGCSLGQGYGLGMPMSGEDFLAWLEGWERENPWQN